MGSRPDSWDIKTTFGLDLATCQETCKKTPSEGGCVGVYFIREDMLLSSQCVAQTSEVTPAVPVTTTFFDSGTMPFTECYRNLSENTDPTPAPGAGGCMVNPKKEKKYGYQDCSQLTKEKKKCDNE